VPSPPDQHHLSPPFPSLPLDPTKTENHLPLCCCHLLSAERDFPAKLNPKMEKHSNGDGILQIIYRWKALGEENMLEQLFSSLVYCTPLASRKKELGCGSELANESHDKTN
jgi:hypothetical protein